MAPYLLSYRDTWAIPSGIFSPILWVSVIFKNFILQTLKFSICHFAYSFLMFFMRISQSVQFKFYTPPSGTRHLWSSQLSRYLEKFKENVFVSIFIAFFAIFHEFDFISIEYTLAKYSDHEI